MAVDRYLQSAIQTDALACKKMAFICGPRQVGKTTLAKKLLKDSGNYFLWDDAEFRKAWSKSPANSLGLRGPGPVLLDEIHKDRRWKTRLKGIFDKQGNDLPVIVTGSARLDVYRKGSDSLLGRYLPYRLHPFSVNESATPPSPDDMGHERNTRFPWEDLLRLGGFPEPLLGGSESKAQRWSRLRLDQLLREDARDVQMVLDLNALRVLADLLCERVGSLLSLNSLREDVGVAYGTIRAWVSLLEALYFCFLLRPYSKKLNRALSAEPKLYLYDILRIPNQKMPARLENLTALHLIKACHYWTDTAQGEFDLRFIRNKDKREVDFLIVRDNEPWLMIECKSNSKIPSPNLTFFSTILKPAHCFQLVSDQKFDKFYPAANIRVLGYEKFFSGLL